MPAKLTIGSQAEKWRLRCLADERYDLEEGHSNWFPIDGFFRCRTCAEQARTNPEVDPEYEALKDTRTGEYLTRPDVVFASNCPQGATGA